MNGAHTPLMLWIEAVVALVIMLAFVLHCVVAFKPQHVEHHPARVRIGAAIQGLTIGLLIGFVVAPLRMQYMDVIDARSAPGLSTLSFVPALIMLIAIRRGALLKVPVLRKYLRAYRRAGLLKARDDADKALAKLDQIEGRGATI
ncbi:MAG: hypothetical protein K2P58_09700 [Hyphomonadaceae bacterium]|nr:hypothetical protein [Hyphomonadaceae bacterium]